MLFSRVFIIIALSFHRALAGSWASVPLIGPPAIAPGEPAYSFAPLRLGGQVIDFVVTLSGFNLMAWTYNCPFCPGSNNYNPTRSPTKGPDLVPFNNLSEPLSGAISTDFAEFAEGLGANTSINMVEQFRSNFTVKPPGGIFSLAVDTPDFHVTSPRSGSASAGLFADLQSSGQLLNPVVGLRLGGDNDGKLDVGYIDESAYEGEIDWIPLVDPHQNWSLPFAIPLDEIRGASDVPINGTQNTIASIDSFTAKYIYLQNDVYETFLNETREIADFVSREDEVTTILPCNTPNMTIRPIINGIDYPVSTPNLMFNISGGNNCTIGILQTGDDGPVPQSQRDNTPSSTLGISWLRSVYFVYRLPTDGCPGHIGIARAANRDGLVPQLSATPRSPLDSNLRDKCFNFKQATGSGANIAMKNTSAPVGYDPQTYSNDYKQELYTVYEGFGKQYLMNAKELRKRAPRLMESNTTVEMGIWGIFGND